MYLTFEKYVTVKGIPAYRFKAPKEVFANVSVNPDNIGFCVSKKHCMSGGVLNATACKKGM